MEETEQESRQRRHEDAPSRAVLRCKYCGFGTYEDVIKAALWTDGGLVVIEDIPARLCEGCGEQFFEEKVTQSIEKVLACLAAKAKQRIRVPVYSMSQPGLANSTIVTTRASSIRRQGARDEGRGMRDEERGAQTTEAHPEHEETLRCKYCASETVEALVKSAFWVEAELIAVENMPARVCQQCKEHFYDEATAEKITALQKGKSFPEMTKRQVLVPVFSLADIEKCLG